VGSNEKKEFRYGVLTEDDMQNFLKEHEESIKSGDIKVLKGFDKKYYAINTNLLNTIRQRILKEIESQEKSVKDISEKTGLDEELCKCALEILKEEGAVFEKRKGWYKSVGSGA
jgi:predicted transcriptional regulator